MSRTRARWQEAAARLQPHRRDAAGYAAVWSIVLLLLTLVGCTVQRLCFQTVLLTTADFVRAWNHWDVFLLLCILGGGCLTCPLRTQMEWWLGETIGVLDACDCGFLACSSHLWLWSRRIVVTGCKLLLEGICWLLPVTLGMAAIVCWRVAMQQTEAILPLFFAANCLLLGGLSIRLPLRVWCGMAALPLCFLKQPNWSAPRLIIQALRTTKGICPDILWMRICCLPWLLLPFTALAALPTLVTSEWLLSAKQLAIQERRHAELLHLANGHRTETTV